MSAHWEGWDDGAEDWPQRERTGLLVNHVPSVGVNVQLFWGKMGRARSINRETC